MMFIIFVYFSLINCDLVLYFTGLIKLFQVNSQIIITFKIKKKKTYDTSEDKIFHTGIFFIYVNTLLLEFKFCVNHMYLHVLWYVLSVIKTFLGSIPKKSMRHKYIVFLQLPNF